MKSSSKSHLFVFYYFHLMLMISLSSCGEGTQPNPQGTSFPRQNQPGHTGSPGPSLPSDLTTTPTSVASDDKLGNICAGIVRDMAVLRDEIKMNPLKKLAHPLKDRNELEDRFLKTHNDIRRRYGLPDLAWDNSLADYSQRWADHLRDTNKCTMQHRKDAGMREGKRYGE